MGHVAYRITNQKYIMAIKQAFVTLMPIIITGHLLYWSQI